MTALSPAARTTVARASAALDHALDEVREWLVRVSGDLEVESKSDGTPVTHADREVDDRLRERLLGAFPDHGMLSEERSTRSPDTSWTWIVDPIDGTSNFTCRLPYWCVSVALALDGEPVLGVVDAPVLGRRYHAIRGDGATVVSTVASLDGRVHPPRERRLAVRPTVDWRDPANRHVPVMLTTNTARHARSAGVRLNPRVMGSTALDMAVVAEGVAAASVSMVPKVWDVAAGVLLIEEAGGAVVSVDGQPLLPMPTDQEQAGRAVITATGPTTEYVSELTRLLLPG